MTEFTTELYNGILITTNTTDKTFNVSRLIKHYQPQNKDVARYLKSKQFKVLYGLALQNEENQIPQIADLNLTHENYLKSFNTIKGRGRNSQIQGLY
jgi:hypothetical protein